MYLQVYQEKIVIHTRKKLSFIPEKKCINVCQYIFQDYITQCDPLSLMIDVTLCHLMSITIFTRVTYDHTLLSVFFVTIIEMSLSLSLLWDIKMWWFDPLLWHTTPCCVPSLTWNMIIQFLYKLCCSYKWTLAK